MLRYRRLPFQHLKNARDLGGYPTKDGGCTVWGRFLRSELPRQLDAADRMLLQALDVRHSVDLRGTGEIEKHPSALRDLSFIQYHRFPLFDARAAAIAAGTELAPQAPGEKGPWGQAYVDMAESQKLWARETLEAISCMDGCVQYNCTTGKDRTGLLTALLLGIAGVEDGDIVADYCVSQVYLFPVYREMEQFFPFRTPEGGLDLSSPFFCTAPENMETLLAHLHSGYGGAAGYVRACGLPEAALLRLRRKLTEE